MSLQASERRFGVPEIVIVRLDSNGISSTPAGGFEANACCRCDRGEQDSSERI